MPRYVKFSGAEAPKLADLSFATQRGPPPKRLHVKPEAVGTIDYSKFDTLDMTDRKRAILSKALEWICSPRRLATVLARGAVTRQARNTTLSADELEMLVAIKRVHIMEEPEHFFLHKSNATFANVFTVLELAKERRRIIIEPLINDLIQKSDLLTHQGEIALLQKAEARAIAAMPFVAVLDASAFFDQFPVHNEVAPFFAFRLPNRHACRNIAASVLPMGFKPSVDIAQAAALALLDFKHVGTTRSGAYVDNFIFGAESSSDLTESVKIFLERCAHVGVVINDKPEDPASIVLTATDSFDFLGERYEPGPAGTRVRTLTASTREKLGAARTLISVWQKRGQIPRRMAAALFGILFYASPIMEVILARYFTARHYYSMQIAGTTDWELPISPPCSSVIDSIFDWIKACEQASPVPATGSSRRAEYQTVCYVDASVWGWGATIENSDGSMRHLSYPWTATDRSIHNVAASSIAEPLALRRLLTILLSTATPRGRAIKIFSDHAALVSRAAYGHANTEAYNAACLAIAEAEQQFGVQIDVSFVPGTNNKADALSRGFPSFGPPPIFPLESVVVGRRG
jgi:hypothetical protein